MQQQKKKKKTKKKNSPSTNKRRTAKKGIHKERGGKMTRREVVDEIRRNKASLKIQALSLYN
eukprot:CAMPEP_0194751098 /NCGR_PEP_ID=MMETSP0323_2-20130528/5204_1 /TAXON_ID=2866 ORGANISM="Crypthecodinium cohnii, Strain Seligo" /NCGR_SAMPLE_ID=MMETSP0323_2 /ASSEMBLY_ACC=CAM_ASM_000346 /LENGTH=61 /DNA_ID=CAMNT_0039667407 /DNA_START=93 /DNA_END=275 /DNA_ORIENTATION=-